MRMLAMTNKYLGVSMDGTPDWTTSSRIFSNTFLLIAILVHHTFLYIVK